MSNKQASFALAKTLHHLAAAVFYLNLYMTESGAGKELQRFLYKRIGEVTKIIDLLLRRITTKEAREEIVRDTEDPLAMDAFTDGYIALTPDNRLKVEEYMFNLYNLQPNGIDTKEN